ncbi:MAG: hypothetical protein ACI9YT_002237 [Halobacteriales archaeon]|jgi:hypothetical protein
MDQERGISSDLEDTLEEHRRGSTTVSGTLVVSDQEAYVGDEITLRGANLPADREFDLYWRSTEGRWGVIKANEVVGPQYSPRTDRIGSVRTDESGGFELDWEIPQDYGGSHAIELRTGDDDTVAKAEVDITPWFEIDGTDATMGEAFTITGYGLGPNFLTNNYQVTWDNSTVGFMTGVQNRGTATARIRAVGPPGDHVIRVWRNYYGLPYLQNNTQSPFGPVAGGRQSGWTVTTTEPEEPPETAWVDPLLDENPLPVHYPELDEDTEAEISVSPTSGQPGTTVFISGEDFPANTEVELIWYRHEGEHAQGIPITAEPKPDVLPNVTTDENGAFQVEVEMQQDVGGTRPITANVDGTSVAVTGFMMQPDIVDITPKRGPVGTEIEVEITGIGWTEYETAPFFVYDNKMLGYVCGQDLPTKRAKFDAAGEPGWHFIDVYPNIFPETDADELDFGIRPHLSYLDNHPVRPLPALHLAFEITE